MDIPPGTRKSTKRILDSETKSTGSKRGRKQVKEETKLFEGPPGFTQTTITQIPTTATVQIKDPLVTLEEAYQQYKGKKRELKLAQKHYRIIRDGLKYTISPPDSEDEI